MEVGPTCHYVMGGVEVDADTAASTVAGLFAAGEVTVGSTGPTVSAATRSPTSWSSDGGPGAGAAATCGAWARSVRA